jgi:hypothetical protein
MLTVFADTFMIATRLDRRSPQADARRWRRAGFIERVRRWASKTSR